MALTYKLFISNTTNYLFLVLKKKRRKYKTNYMYLPCVHSLNLGRPKLKTETINVLSQRSGYFVSITIEKVPQ